MDFTDKKRQLVRDGIYKNYCIWISRYGFIPSDWIIRSIKDGVDFQSFVGVSYHSDDYRILRNMYSSRCHQLQRIKKRIDDYFKSSKNCYFLTFTLNDDNVDVKYQILERRIKILFKDSGIENYIIHQDFGLDDRFSHRLHYHAIVTADHVSQIKAWSYGYYNYKPITNKNSKRLAIYLNKLANHYIKESNYNKRVIFSRTRG